jgi:predicted TIM-barrel fold metal-dependent hydrolase
MMGRGGPEATRAFNDALAAYESVDPKRLVVSYQIPIHDIDLAVREVERIAAVGGKSLQLPVFPTELGLPDYVDGRYDRLWSVIQATGLPICCHTGFNTHLDDLHRRDPTPQGGITVPMIALSCGEAFGMWILGGIFERFPELKLVFVEPGLGWVAWWIRYVDTMVTKQAYVFPALQELPSFYFHRNVFVTFMEEEVAVQLLRHELGIANMLWASDYPHPPTTWPNSRAIVDQQFRDVPDAERSLIVSGNAARIWNLDA